MVASRKAMIADGGACRSCCCSWAAGVVVLLLSTVGTQARRTMKSNGIGKRPNVILFQPDGFPWVPNQWPEAPAPQVPGADGLLSFGNRNLDLPNINRLRNRGLVFGNYTVVASAAGTSRFATITGRYNSRGDEARERSEDEFKSLITDRVTVENPKTRLARSDLSENLPHAMKQIGYRTGAAGLWNLGKGPGSDYDDLQDSVKEAGFDWADGLYADVRSVAGRKYSHNMEWVTAQAKDFMKKTSDRDEPFFLYFNPTTPQSREADVYTALFNYSILETPAGSLDEDPESGMPSRVDMWAKAQQALIPSEIAAAGTPGLNAASVALGVVVTDEALGALVGYLKDLDILDDTLIVFMGDYGVEGYRKLYQAGVRVPFFISGPGFKNEAGDSTECLVANVDLARSLVDITTGDDDYPFFTDGISFLPVLKGNPIHNKLFLEHGVNRAIKLKNYKLIHLNDVQQNLDNSGFAAAFPNGNAPTVTRVWPAAADVYQFYDTAKDPTEQRNIIDTNDEFEQERRDVALELLTCFEQKLKLSVGDAHRVSIEDCQDRKWCDDDDCDQDGDDDDGVSALTSSAESLTSFSAQKAESKVSNMALAFLKASWSSAIQGLVESEERKQKTSGS